MEDLFTVNVFRVSDKKCSDSQNSGELDIYDRSGPFNGLNLIEEHPNMISASVIKGKMIELEHSSLVGQSVKFKTVVNYNRVLEPGSSLGVVLTPQDGYIAKPDHDEPTTQSG